MEKALQRRRRDIAFTEGGVFGKIIIFALPIMFTNVLQILFNAADMIVVGRFSGVEGAVGAVGSTGPIYHLIINLLVGVSVGANVIVANAVGAKDDARIKRAVHTAISLGFMVGVVCLIIGVTLSRRMLMWLDADEALIDMSALYLRICFLGAPFLALNNYAASIFRAKGDARTPMIVMTSAGLLNVVLNLFFVCICHMSVDGVATATLIANGTSACVLLFLLSRAKDATRFHFKSLFRMDRSMVRRMLGVGVPAGLQSALFSFSNIFVQRAINGCGTAVIEGNAIATQMDGFMFTATNAFHQAALTFGGQNIGASRYDRLGRITRACYGASLSVSVVLVAFFYSIRTSFVSLYIGAEAANGEQIMAEALLRIGCSTVLCSAQALMDTGSGLMRAMNRSMTAFFITAMGICVFRVVWIYAVFIPTSNLKLLYYSFPMSWFVTGAVLLVYVLRIKKKLLLTHQNS